VALSAQIGAARAAKPCIEYSQPSRCRQQVSLKRVVPSLSSDPPRDGEYQGVSGGMEATRKIRQIEITETSLFY